MKNAMSRARIRFGSTQRRVLALALVVTLALWLVPPVRRVRQIQNIPGPIVPLPSSRVELRSEWVWIGRLRRDDDVWLGMLLARTVAVWTATIVVLEFLRRPEKKSAGG